MSTFDFPHQYVMLTLNDRLLLALDPGAFVDAATIGTPLASGADGTIAGTVLTSAGSDFAARGVDDGQNVLAMLARRQLRHHAAVRTMHVVLRGD